MTDDVQGRQAAPSREDGHAAQADRRRHRRLLTVLIAIAVLLAVFIVPPLISIGRYKSRITQVISQSFGRPVRLSSVKLRLLPWPGFVLTDLSVAEDPAYGAEPVLHANSVTANIRLLSLWRGRLEISSVSVDEASLNVVRAAPGRWNLDPLFRTAAAKAGSRGGEAHRFPYLEATNSRINFKNGAEKLPFSLVDTDLSFWQESPSEWRLSLRGQPARTDVVLDLGDTGIVRLEASVHRAPELRLMPLRVDLDWRQAQLGQLSRLLIGYDPGWRGDLTGELHMEGTPDAAKVTTRLLAYGVHRAEFAPASPLDFDANCGFVVHYSTRAIDDLVCNSPLGDGRLQLTGDVPDGDAAATLTLALDRIPVAAGMDVLRTMRIGFNPDLEAAGTISGKLTYAQRQGTREQGNKGTKSGKERRTHANVAALGPLSGSLTVEGFELSGGSLRQPLRAPRMVLEPAEITPGAIASGSGPTGGTHGPEMLAGTVAIPAGGKAPLVLNLRLALYGYEAGIHGQASLARARELAQMAGQGAAPLLEDLAGEPLTASLIAEGPWLQGGNIPPIGEPPSTPTVAPTPGPTPGPVLRASLPASPGSRQAAGPQLSAFDRCIKPAADSISGTITVHSVNWRADYLANHVEIAEATLHLGDGALRWDPVAFSYGPIKGTASVTWPVNCAVAVAQSPAACAVQFQAQFGRLDASEMEAAFLGARRTGTLLSNLIARFQPASAPPWPPMEGAINADSLQVGPVMLRQVAATVKIADEGAEIGDLTAGALGGQVKASGTVQWGAGDQAAPAYTVTAQLDGLSAAAVGQLLGLRWPGGAIKASGKIDLSGFTGKDLASSAKGTLHFDWRHGAVVSQGATRVTASSKAAPLPPALAHFDDWTGDAQIAAGAITLGKNQMVSGARKRAIEGSVTFGKPPKVQFVAANRRGAEKAEGPRSP